MQAGRGDVESSVGVYRKASRGIKSSNSAKIRSLDSLELVALARLMSSRSLVISSRGVALRDGVRLGPGWLASSGPKWKRRCCECPRDWLA